MKPLFVQHDGQTQGPFTYAQLSTMLDSGALPADALSAAEGDSDWRPLIENLPGRPPMSAKAAPSTIKKLRADSAYSLGRVMLNLWLFLSLVGCVILIILPFASQQVDDFEYLAIGLAGAIICLILHELGLAMFDRADCALAAALRQK
jgi:hypothetical protein